MEATPCPLCQRRETTDYYRGKRLFLACTRCDLVYVHPRFLLTLEQEKAIYDLHQNNADDPRYLGFLRQFTDPLVSHLAKPAKGLDYGCGPGPTVDKVLSTAGHQMSIYDPIYFPNQSVLELTYDFITCTEVVEHMHQPLRELRKVWRLLQVGGTLAIMTNLRNADTDFPNWHYQRDPTHVCFFSIQSLQYHRTRCNRC